MPKKKPELNSLEQLKPSPTNPREIAMENVEALKASMRRYGDLSGITWNKRSGNLVTGHQRLSALKDEHPGLTLDTSGETPRLVASTMASPFPVRVVDMDPDNETAANLAANHDAMAGIYTEDVDEQVRLLAESMPDVWDELRLYEISSDDDDGAVGGGDDEPEEKEDEDQLPGMEIQPYEHYDYILVVADNTQDWEWLVDKFKLKKVNASTLANADPKKVGSAGRKKIGLGRAIRASRLINLIEGGNAEAEKV